MKSFIIATALLVASCSASFHGAVSSQYASLDPHSHSYSYGYADPNSQKHESRSHDGVTHGSYSYVDGHGHIQSVHYTADPHTGFHASGTNLPKGPAPAAHVAHAGAYDGGHYAAGHSYHGPQAHITLTHEGVPHDTPEVAHAKAAHAAAHANAAAAAAHGGHHHLYKRSLWGHGGYAAHAAPVVLTHGGVPVDTPDVQAAKAEHYAAHAQALGAAAHGHGAPHDTPEVAHAKAAHFAAHAAASSGHGGPSAHAVAAHGYHVPVIHNGVPVETPEVQHAKAAHYAAVAKASASAGPSGHSDDGSYDGRWDGDHSAVGSYDGSHGGHGGAPAHYATSAHHGHYGGPYHGPLHIPVIHNGVPVEPAEVQHARAAHLNALAAESHNSAGHGYYGKW